jgi:hypothetical protein
MTSFKKFVHAKEKITETIGFPKTMNKNYIIHKELQSINEFAGAAAATKGGEIDSLIVAVGAAGALFAKAMYNGVIYASLKGELPTYLEKYKTWSAPSAEAVFKDKTGKAIQKLKQQKATLSGTGGDREDRSGKPEESAEQKITKMFKAKIENAEGEAKENLRKQRDEAIEKVKVNIQGISKKIEDLQNKSDDAFLQGVEKFRQEEEKWVKKQDGFVEGGGMLGSSWKKKWEVEYRNAKEAAKLEVLALAKKIATDAKNDKEIAAITKSEERAKQAQAEADAKIGEVEKESEQAEREMADASQFKIPEYIQAVKSFDMSCAEAYEEWDKKKQGLDKGEEGEEGEDDKESTKKATQDKIDALKEKLGKINKLLVRMKDEGKDDVVKRAQAAITKIKSDISAEEEKLKESFDDYYSMQLRLIEANDMINNLVIQLGLFEDDKEESSVPDDNQVPTLSQIRSIVKTVIAKSPEDGRTKEAQNAIETFTKLKAVKQEMNDARNAMAGVFKAQAEEENKEKKLSLSPELSKAFGSLKEVDPKEGIDTYDNYIKELSEDNGVEEAEAKAAKEKAEKEAAEQAAAAQSNLDITDDVEEPQATEETPDESDPADSDKPEVKAQKEKVKKLKGEIADLKTAAADKKNKDSGFAAGAVPGKEKELTKELEKLKELQKDDAAEEAVEPEEDIEDADDDIEDTKDKSPSQSSPKPLPKFMKFEDYIISKQKK